jgi:hypothetical protein
VDPENTDITFGIIVEQNFTICDQLPLESTRAGSIALAD